MVLTEVDDEGLPIEGTGYLALVVLNDLCVGCGFCQMSCFRVNVKQEGLLTESAIIVEAGERKEDRLMTGSYRQLRSAEHRARLDASRNLQPPPTELPAEPEDESNPFGLP